MVKSNSDASTFLLQFADVSDENKSMLLSDLKQPNKETICEKRIQFLVQTINSNLLFPFVVNHQEALHLSAQLDKVVAMLDWSKSGRVMMYYTPSNGDLIDARPIQAKTLSRNILMHKRHYD